MNSLSPTSSTLKKEKKSTLPPFPVGCYNVDLGHILGRGSYGTVFRATHTTTQAVCAVKNITFQGDDDKIAKFEQSANRELEILQRLSHKNIVQYYDIEVFSASWWIFLEYCESGNLSQYLEKNKTINDHAKFDIKAQCAEAVKYIHGQNIIHRDIKLENYLVQKIDSGIVIKLSDFGLSKVVKAYGSDQSLTKNRGTSYYRSPEQFQGCRYSNKVDIFSLGLVFLVITEFGVTTTNTFPQSVEALSLGRKSYIGIEMNERKVVTLMKSNTDEDSYPNRGLIKGLVQDMAQKDPCKRIDIQEVCKRLQQISATCSAPRSAMSRDDRNVSTSPTFSTEDDSISNLFDSIASRELGSSLSSPFYAERNEHSTTNYVRPHTDIVGGFLSLEDLKFFEKVDNPKQHQQAPKQMQPQQNVFQPTHLMQQTPMIYNNGQYCAQQYQYVAPARHVWNHGFAVKTESPRVQLPHPVKLTAVSSAPHQTPTLSSTTSQQPKPAYVITPTVSHNLVDHTDAAVLAVKTESFQVQIPHPAKPTAVSSAPQQTATLSSKTSQQPEPVHAIASALSHYPVDHTGTAGTCSARPPKCRLFRRTSPSNDTFRTETDPASNHSDSVSSIESIRCISENPERPPTAPKWHLKPKKLSEADRCEELKDRREQDLDLIRFILKNPERPPTAPKWHLKSNKLSEADRCEELKDLRQQDLDLGVSHSSFLPRWLKRRRSKPKK